MVRTYIVHRARKTFKEYMTCEDISRVKFKIKEARRQLHRIKRANEGDKKSALRVLEEAYGRVGKVRHGLLNPILYDYQPTDMTHPSPLVPHVPRTAPPPPMCPPLCALILQDLNKKLEPELPVPAFKPLHRGREANLLWRHRTLLLDMVSVPLPYEIVCELEMKAGATPDHPLYVGTLKRGGPIYHEFYSHTDCIRHLSPTLSSIKPSTFIRTLKWPISPYDIQKQPKSILSYLEEDREEVKTYEISSRHKRRLYRRLLKDVPVIDVFTGMTLWNRSIKYSVTKSYWAPKSIHHELEDVPDVDVLQSTLHSSKKIRRL